MKKHLRPLLVTVELGAETAAEVTGGRSLSVSDHILYFEVYTLKVFLVGRL